MADKNTPNPPGPKKPAVANSRLEQAQKKAQAMTSGSGRKPISTGDFFKEVVVELKKTTWPNRDVTAKSTTVVLALVLATAVYVGILDFILTKLFSPLFGSH